MSQPKKLWKSEITIWSEFNPQEVEIDTLAREAISGDAYCSKKASKLIEDPASDPDWDGTEFFDCEEE